MKEMKLKMVYSSSSKDEAVESAINKALESLEKCEPCIDEIIVEKNVIYIFYIPKSWNLKR
jgi:hypothetical protein